MGETLRGLVQAQACLPGPPRSHPPQRHQVLCFLSLGVPQASACSQAGHSARQGSLKLAHGGHVTACKPRPAFHPATQWTCSSPSSRAQQYQLNFSFFCRSAWPMRCEAQLRFLAEACQPLYYSPSTGRQP